MIPKHTILLVEDEIEPAEMLASFLEMNNFNVLLAHDGREALELIEQRAGEIHLAILDIKVPHVDDKEICRAIHKHPVLNRIPVIFLTANDKDKYDNEHIALAAKY